MYPSPPGTHSLVQTLLGPGFDPWEVQLASWPATLQTLL